MTTFSLDISYAQIAVFDARLAAPYNDWKDQHVAQGFAWRPGSVSFGTLESGGPIRVEVILTRVLDEKTSLAERIIAVPFTVPEHEAVEVASIGSGASFDLVPGEYEITFEHGRDPAGNMWANFYFRRVSVPVSPRVLRADAELTPPSELVMIADSA